MLYVAPESLLHEIRKLKPPEIQETFCKFSLSHSISCLAVAGTEQTETYFGVI
jgi:hypothetical protein